MSDSTLHSVNKEALLVKKTQELHEWKAYQKITFRIAFVLFLLLVIPFTSRYYKIFTEIDWLHLHCRNVYNIASGGFGIDFIEIETESGKWGIASYVNLGITLLISIVVGLLWTLIDKKSKHYNQLYYWARVIVRYRVAFSMIAWGYRKLLPMQMVWPTEAILRTPFIDMQEQKLYWQSVGIVPGYEVFLGFAECLAGFLLLFRKTTALGAALTTVVLGNIVIANHVYDGSVHLHSFHFALLGFLLLWYDLPRIYQLLVTEKDVLPVHYYPAFNLNWQKYLRTGLKAAGYGIFVVLLLILQWDNYLHDSYRIPSTPGLKNAKGYYEVSSFSVNDKAIPYNPFDTLRWQDAIFEQWSTLSYKVNRVQEMDRGNGGGAEKKDIDRTWEHAGLGGGRHFYYYGADTIAHVLHLQNKKKEYRELKQTLHYDRPSSNQLVLKGKNEFNDSIHVVLDRSDKDFPLLEGRQSPIHIFK